jgi:muramoyltetrapeptide carboxypeptidase
MLLKPRCLKRGDVVGVVAPSSPLLEESTIELTINWLDKLGLRVELGRHIFERHGDHAGLDADRVLDFHSMWRNPQIAAIFALRGGNGSVRLLPLLDYELIKRHPKIFIGFSDITGLLIAIHQRTGLITFHGPNAGSFYDSTYTHHYFRKAILSPKPIGLIVDPLPQSFAPLSPPCRVVISEGEATGMLVGGSLTLIRQTMGTPYEIDTTNKILFIEEYAEDPHCIDRMLTQLLLANKLQRAAGIVVGECFQCRPGESRRRRFYLNHSVDSILRDRLGRLGIPVIYGLRFGHGMDRFTIPLGVRATLKSLKGNVRFSIIESATM